MNLTIARHTGLIAAVALTLGAGGIQRQSVAAQGSGRQAPMFEVDPFWPKPLPNHWVTGSTIGLSVDAQDNVWTIHRPNTVEDNFKAADIKVGEARGRDDEAQPGAPASQPTAGAGFIGKCCKVAPPVLVYDQAGNLVKSWGGPGQGYDWPDSNHGSPSTTRATSGWPATAPRTPKILKFTGAGAFLSSWASTASTTGSNDIENSGSRQRDLGRRRRPTRCTSATEYGNRRKYRVRRDTGK
jgi:hypothetical protein